MKIVVITAYASRSTRRGSNAPGCDRLHPETVHPAQVLLAVRKVEEVRTLEQKVATLREDLESTTRIRFSSASPPCSAPWKWPAGRTYRRRACSSAARAGLGKPFLARAIHGWSRLFGETVRRGVVPLPAGGTAGK